MTLFKDRFKGRTIVVNQFGCEVLPLALRLAFPRRRIIAIAHTHPGSGAAARCVVRSIVERLCYASVSDIVYSSRSVKEGWTRRFGQAELKGRVILHGIAAPDRAVPDDYPDKPVGTVDFLCAAQFLPMKGQAVLLEAWERALASGLVNARLIFVGDGACFEEVRQSAMRRNLLSSVHFLGARPDGARYFNGADVGVLMSTEAEAFGLVLLEAMSRGKPVLASRSGGIPEVVVHGETGLLVDPSQPEEVAQAVRRLASSAEERARMGGNGHGRWQELFCVERMLREYREYFEAE
jgi:glycosyltransferase involved in cell wall biosynthesis